MAVCPKCRGEMGQTEAICPHCGYDFPEPARPRPVPALVSLGLVAVWVTIVILWGDSLVVRIVSGLALVVVLVCLWLGAVAVPPGRLSRPPNCLMPVRLEFQAELTNTSSLPTHADRFMQACPSRLTFSPSNANLLPHVAILIDARQTRRQRLDVLSGPPRC